MMKSDVNRNGWWKTEDLVKQVNTFFIYYFKNNNLI